MTPKRRFLTLIIIIIIIIRHFFELQTDLSSLQTLDYVILILLLFARNSFDCPPITDLYGSEREGNNERQKPVYSRSN